MALKEFGTDISLGDGTKTDQDFVNEIYELVGRKFDMSIIVKDGKVIYFSYQTSWKTGGTTPVETGEFVKIPVETEDVDEEGNSIIIEIETDTPVYDYVEDYTEEELTPAEISTINTWAEQNVEG